MGVYLWVESYSAMQWPCPSGFHIPLLTEWEKVYNIWVSLSAWSSSSWTWTKTYLFLPFAWARSRSNGNYDSASNSWWYWSAKSSSSAYQWYCFINGASETTYNWWQWKSVARSIRPFKDSAVVPDNSWTVLKQWTWNAWIYHNSTLWLISLSSDWNDWTTISDKNLWATTVYSDWATLSESNCGKFYQWWNNYWFPFTWSITTSTSQVNASSYWPWNYYNSSTFIIRSSSPQWWDSSDNANLRWWETWVLPYSELKNAYIGEVYEYSYDFRNSNQAAVIAEWWNIISGTPSFNSNGIYWSNVRVHKSIPSLNATSKIKLTCNYINNSSNNWSAYGLSEEYKTWYKGNLWGNYLATSGCNRFVWQTSINYSWVSWTWSWEMNIDLWAKTAVFTNSLYNSWAEQTKTLTDTEIANVLLASTIRFYLDSGGIIQKISLTIEK